MHTRIEPFSSHRGRNLLRAAPLFSLGPWAGCHGRRDARVAHFSSQEVATMNAKLVALVLGAVLVFAAAPAAQACDGGYGGFGPWGAYDIGRLYRTLQNNVPHFAAFPPVYYSYPVPRTYGYGPFAYPPHVRTPDVVVTPVKPVTIINPYVKQDEEKAAEEEKPVASAARQPQPLVILNPYVEQPVQLAKARKLAVAPSE